MGSGIYRSIQFSAFEATYTLMDTHFGKIQIPLTNGLQVRVICGGIMSGTMRAIIETPLEYAKIKRQTGHNWKFKDSYTVEFI
jgi:solute carrier family 25 carnitine/acylcarnitine transporter 20/29